MALQQPLLDDPEAQSRSDPAKFEVWREVKMQVVIAGPMIVVGILNFIVPISSVMFVGHLGKLSLASASLASSSCNVTGFIILMGMSAALETLCGQAYGAKQHSLLGVYLQRAIFVLLLISIPISILWFYIGDVLRALGQDPLISSHTEEYARFLVPGLFGSALVWPSVKFLQAQYVVAPMAIFSLITAIVHVFLCWIFIYQLHIGAKGAAICVSISYWLNALMLLAYIKFSSTCKTTFTGITKNALHDFRGFFKLAIPATVMICFEACSFEILTLLSGLLPNPQLETSTLVTFYMIPSGFSAAVSTRVANELGAGNHLVAKSAVGVTLCMAALNSILSVVVFLAFRKSIGWVYSNETDVVEHIASLLKVAFLIAACDPIQCVLGGVVRGCGWQAVGALANLTAFYVVGLPTAVVLGFVFKFYGMGLWIGIACGNATQTIILCFLTFFMNWENQVKSFTPFVSKAYAIVV
ncbi:hypothetical protein SELMODRAFT_118985 [Selaginella moellendorffii]|uniref:Protein DETOXIFICATION n=2 Tax=Selaginella moellendorffii TaxID=88036 RepID=D8SK72_SELML|nr:hypothetical protein SELMODRAFT_118985 [Selaginella moellendorffii]